MSTLITIATIAAILLRIVLATSLSMAYRLEGRTNKRLSSARSEGCRGRSCCLFQSGVRCLFQDVTCIHILAVGISVAKRRAREHRNYLYTFIQANDAEEE